MHADGVDPWPEYARVTACAVADGEPIGWLQYSADPPGGVAIALSLRDPTTGVIHRSPTPDTPQRPLDRPEDVRSGRVTFEVRLSGSVQAPQRLHAPDCRVTLHRFP